MNARIGVIVINFVVTLLVPSNVPALPVIPDEKIPVWQILKKIQK
jgi:hypothetical protein